MLWGQCLWFILDIIYDKIGLLVIIIFLQYVSSQCNLSIENFPYQKEADEKYFNGYGVKFGSNENSKNSYVNSINQIFINLDRKLSYELFF